MKKKLLLSDLKVGQVYQIWYRKNKKSNWQEANLFEVESIEGDLISYPLRFGTGSLLAATIGLTEDSEGNWDVHHKVTHKEGDKS